MLYCPHPTKPVRIQILYASLIFVLSVLRVRLFPDVFGNDRREVATSDEGFFLIILLCSPITLYLLFPNVSLYTVFRIPNVIFEHGIGLYSTFNWNDA
jgi:hypothetical protein